MRKIKYSSILVFFFSILPIIDSINGYMLMEKNFSIGQIYKTILLIMLVLYYLLSKEIKSRDLISIFLPIIYIFFTLSINNMIMNGLETKYDFAIKLIYNLIFLQLFYSLKKRGRLGVEFFERIFNNNTIMLILVILIPKLLGIGYSTYKTGQGYKGFYYAQNELNAILVILFIYNIRKLMKKFNFANLIKFMLIFLCALILETKSSMILCIGVLIIYLYNYLRNNKFKYKILVIPTVIITTIAVMKTLEPVIQSFQSRQAVIMNNFDNSFFVYITSGRLLFLIDAYQQLKISPIYIFNIFFGNGFTSNYLVEMDFIDIFYYLGLFGVIYTIKYIIKILVNINKKSFLDIFDFLVVIIFSFFTGHVLFMATSGIYFVLFCCNKME